MFRICENRGLNITKKRGPGGNITACLKIKKRQKWVNHLVQHSQVTSTKQYNERQINIIENKCLKKILIEKFGFENSI
jgi:transcriptional regulator CtsR